MDIDQDYASILEYLYGRLPFFSRQGAKAYQKDLSRTLALCARWGNPELGLPVIHVAGTNGKGSTSHMLAAMLRHAGYKVGLYTSPHLVDFRERIRWQGVPVPSEWVVQFVKERKRDIEEISPSFFELTVAMALCYFAQKKPDFVIMEAGLGGRLDSTNVVQPLISVITNISWDHQDILGHSLEAIAREKAGIIKPGVPVVIGQSQAETERIFLEKALQMRATLYYAESQWDLVKIGADPNRGYRAVQRSRGLQLELKTDLKGNYQAHNIRTVLMVMDLLIHRFGLPLEPKVAVEAFSEVRRLSGIRGRWEVLQEQPLVLVDVAHNPAGLREVMDQWASVKASRKHLVIGMVADKDVAACLRLLPKGETYHFVQAKVPRALPLDTLEQMAAAEGLQGTAHGSVDAALTYLTRHGSPQDAVLVTGSFFVVGEAITWAQVTSGELFPETSPPFE